MASHATGIVDNSSNDPIVQVLAEHERNSEIWNSYNMVVLASGKRKAQCKMCQALLTAKGNSTLRRHAEKTCPSLKLVEGDSSRPTLDKEGGIWTFDVDLNRNMTTMSVVPIELSSEHFDNIYISNKIQQMLQPRCKSVSHQALKRDALKLWKTCQNEMRQIFSLLPSCVSLTCDVWSAPHGLPHSYLCITAHWIEPQSWQLVKRVITFEPFGVPHTGDRLFAIIKRNLAFYNLSQKIVSITFDNASNNTACVSKLVLGMKPILNGRLFHTHCCAHVINLVVQDGLLLVRPILDKFRLMLRRIFTKGKKMHTLYKKYCNDLNFKALGPNFDIPIRWDSTYFMIENLLKQREYLHAFYNYYYPCNTISVLDWGVLDGLYDLLGDFKYASTILSGVYYPTCPLLLNQILILTSKLTHYEDNEDWGAVVKKMKAKLLKYFIETPFSFKCAAALHPYLKVTGVEVLISMICLAFGLSGENDDYAKEEMCKFNRDFKDLFKYYKKNYDRINEQQNSSNRSNSSATSSSQHQNREILMTNLFNEIQSEKSRFDIDLGELYMYMHTNFISFSNIDDFESIDLLEWWKQKQMQFPVLALMARDILTIQASAVALESAFSLSGRIISMRMTKLSPESVECCVYLKDYLDSMERTQRTTSLEMGLDELEKNLEDIEYSEQLSTPPTTDIDDTYSTLDDDNDELDL